MPILNLSEVSLNFSASNKPILNGINYDVHARDFIILLGNNGSGKSTLLKLLYRYYTHHAGKIHFLGIPLHQHHDASFASKVAVLTQNCNEALFGNLTVYENYLIAKSKSHSRDKKYLQNYLRDYNANLANKLNVVVDKLSGGEKQVLALAFCFLTPPTLLLLDEHTSALDPKTSMQIMELTQRMIDKYSITCILTTHDLNIALNHGNKILLLQNGRIKKTYNTVEKLKLSREQLMENYILDPNQ